MIKIYHNPRCSKSRLGVQFLEEKKVEFETILYLKKALSTDEIKNIISKLDIQPIDLIRKNEKIWKENFKGKELTDSQLIEAMVANPKLIERPIVIKGNKAVVARPTEKINDIL